MWINVELQPVFQQGCRKEERKNVVGLQDMHMHTEQQQQQKSGKQSIHIDIIDSPIINSSFDTSKIDHKIV